MKCPDCGSETWPYPPAVVSASLRGSLRHAWETAPAGHPDRSPWLAGYYRALVVGAIAKLDGCCPSCVFQRTETDLKERPL